MLGVLFTIWLGLAPAPADTLAVHSPVLPFPWRVHGTWRRPGLHPVVDRHETPAAPTDTLFRPAVHRRIVFQLDTRYSLLDGRLLSFPGLKLGIEWRSRLRSGIGLYGLKPNQPAPVPDDLPYGTTARFRLRYGALYSEYVLVGNPRWEVSVPLQAGVGYYYHEYTSPDGLITRSIKDRVWLLEPSMVGHYRFFRWLGVGAGFGWRQAFLVKPQYENQLNAPVFHLRGKVFLGDLYKVARGRQRLFTQRGLRRADWRPNHLLDDEEAD